MSTDLALGLITLGVAAVYYVAASLLPQSSLDDAIGPQGLPKAYAVVLAGLSLIAIAQAVRRRSRGDTRRGGGAQRRRRTAGMLLIGILYIVAAPWLGYLVSLATLIFVTTYYQGGVIDRHLALVAVSGAVFFWVLFVLVLGIPQPAGLWPSLF